MSEGLRKRVAQTEEDRQVGGDWRQFGSDPRDYPAGAGRGGALGAMARRARQLHKHGTVGGAFGSVVVPVLVSVVPAFEVPVLVSVVTAFGLVATATELV